MAARPSSWDYRRRAAACLNPGTTMGQHAAIQKESPAGAYSPQRNCKGRCRKRRSHTQFTGANAMCNQCVLRAPKGSDA
jgi:hypothetical protein